MDDTLLLLHVDNTLHLSTFIMQGLWICCGLKAQLSDVPAAWSFTHASAEQVDPQPKMLQKSEECCITPSSAVVQISHCLAGLVLLSAAFMKVFLCLGFSVDSCQPSTHIVSAHAVGSFLNACRKSGPADLWASAIITIRHLPNHSS